MVTAQLAPQPRAREPPVAHDGSGADAERFGGLVEAQSPEESHLEHPALPLIELGQTLQSQIDCHHLLDLLGREDDVRLERDLHRCRTATLDAMPLPGVVYEEMTHHGRRHGKEMRTVLPARMA